MVSKKDIVVGAIVQFDTRSKRSKYYNPYALGLMLERADEIAARAEAGMSPAQCIRGLLQDRAGAAVEKALSKDSYPVSK